MGRLERINNVLAILKDNRGTMIFSNLYGDMALKHGVAKRTFWSYLKALKAAKKIRYSDSYHVLGEGRIEIVLLGQE